MSYRIEHDFLGEKQVPEEALYGIQTLRAVENFPITGQRMHPSLIRALAIVKKAAALANAETGNLDHKLADAIDRAASEIIQGRHHEQFIVDPIQGGAGTSMNMNANEVIANRGLELLGQPRGTYSLLSPNSHVNMAQSTNDAFPTAMHIAVLDELKHLNSAMQDLEDAFARKVKEFDPFIKMGRTHLQDAVPIRLGQEFEAYRRVLSRDRVRIAGVGQHLNEVNMGATAVGTGLNADPEYIKVVVKYLAELSGHPIVSASDLIDATQNTDGYTEVSAMLKVCMLNMSKIANDLRLMASGPRCGFGELRLPARQPGSSIMPGKVNPVMAEVMNQVAFQVIGNDTTICLASEAGQFELNVMEPVLIFNLLQSISMMTNVFTVFRKHLLEDLQANDERMREYVENSVGVVTAINPHVGYERAAQLAKAAIESGRPIREVVLESGALTSEELDEILNPYNMTSPGISGDRLLKAKHVHQEHGHDTHK